MAPQSAVLTMLEQYVQGLGVAVFGGHAHGRDAVAVGARCLAPVSQQQHQDGRTAYLETP